MQFLHLKLICISLLALQLLSCSKSADSDPGPTPAPDPPPATQRDIVAVDNAIQNFMTTYNIPGGALAVTRNGKLVYSKGYGVADRSTNEAVTPEHRFRLASLSKTFTGVAILKLVQDGRLGLDDKVFGAGGVLGNDFGTEPYNANLSAITVRQLLQNTSGSWGANSGGDVIGSNQSYTNKQFADWVINTRPNPNVPGTTYDYSNVGFFLAGRVIEKASGKSYVNYIRENLMAPLGITQTDIAGRNAADRKVKEVAYYGQGALANAAYTVNFPRRDADGGLISNAPDLLKFITAFDGFNTRPDILTSASITALTTTPTFSTYACGIARWDAKGIWFNYGALPGTRTGFMRANNGLCVVTLFNSCVDYSASNAAAYTAFGQAHQALLLDLVENTTYAWQDIDQFK
jgi:CubicO group peptidase (beta-lactamase class C family)